MHKLVTHLAEEANTESSAENANVESSRASESSLSHGISNEHAAKVHLLCQKDDAKSYRTGTRLEPPSLTENNINFGKDWLDERSDLIWCSV